MLEKVEVLDVHEEKRPQLRRFPLLFYWKSTLNCVSLFTWTCFPTPFTPPSTRIFLQPHMEKNGWRKELKGVKWRTKSGKRMRD